MMSYSELKNLGEEGKAEQSLIQSTINHFELGKLVYCTKELLTLAPSIDAVIKKAVLIAPVHDIYLKNW